MRQRLRPKHSDEQLKQIYAKPHDHRAWADHHLRVDTTIDIAKWIMYEFKLDSVADLSCGNGSILDGLDFEFHGSLMLHYGDFAPGYTYQGPIEKTINLIPNVDLFVCSETLEHVDDPQFVLDKIADKAEYLVLSTPDSAWDDTNLEHYWAWNKEEIGDMLNKAGFETLVKTTLDLRPAGYMYAYQIWAAKRK